MTKDILLPPETIYALNEAARTVKNLSNNRYELVLTRGHVYWGKWRRFRAKLAKIIFSILYWTDRKDAEVLFGHNGHNDGLSVDVQLYDVRLKKIIRWLSWKNIMISRIEAMKIIETHQETIHMLDFAMNSADFIAHSDPREKLQMHYRLNISGKNLSE